jgi:predicted O-methyltransferase YrrM
VLDERVRGVLARLEAEKVRPPAVPVKPETGRFLFSLVAPQTDCEVLEVGAGRGVSTLWFAAGVRYLGGRVVSLEWDPEVAEDWAELIEGDALELLETAEDVFDVVFLDANKNEYERCFGLARRLVDPGGLVVADNVLSHEETLASYSRARQADRTLVSVTVPLGSGLELTTVLSA